MDRTKRHLQKILNKDSGLPAFEATGEDLGLLVETLREVQQCRSKRHFFLEKFGLDLLVSPANFNRLLTIPEIDTVEIPNKIGDVDRFSLKERRKPEDLVEAADLNIVLQELNHDLVRIRDIRSREVPNLLLATEMTENLLPPATEAVMVLQNLNSPSMGYFFSHFKANKVEKIFCQMFPGSGAAHPLRTTLEQIEKELDFYKNCASINQKWSPLGLDLFNIIRNSWLTEVIENIQRLGSSLWNVVYNGQRLKASFELVGINFEDIRTLLEESKL